MSKHDLYLMQKKNNFCCKKAIFADKKWYFENQNEKSTKVGPTVGRYLVESLIVMMLGVCVCARANSKRLALRDKAA